MRSIKSIGLAAVAISLGAFAFPASAADKSHQARFNEPGSCPKCDLRRGTMNWMSFERANLGNCSRSWQKGVALSSWI